MSGIGMFLSYALVAVFAQNLLLSGAVGASTLLYSVRKPKRLLAVSGLIALFALLSSLTVLPFDYWIPIWSSYMTVRGIMLSIAIMLWYLIITAIAERIPALADSIAEHIPTAAINGAVLGIPLLLNINSITDPVKIIGLCIGAGAGFALVAWLLNTGLRRANNPDIPPALRGAPVMLIYIGILSMAFCAFGDGLELYYNVI